MDAKYTQLQLPWGGASQNTRFSTLGEKATADAVQIPVIVLCVVNTDDTTFVLRRAVALLNPATQQTPSRCWWSCVEGRLPPATQIAPPLRQTGPLQLGVIFSFCHLRARSGSQ